MEIKKTLSVIIVSYGSENIILDALISIKKYNDIDAKNLEVIIVDNSPAASAIEIEKIVKKFSTEANFDVIYKKNTANLGYGQGNNVGVSMSKGDVICVMNPDVRLCEPLFSKVIYEFNKNKNYGSIGFKQIGAKGHSFFPKPEYYYPVLTYLAFRLLSSLSIFMDRYFYLSGAMVYFDKKSFLSAGGYDENIFLYFEEPDVSKRLNKVGRTNKFFRGNKYIHFTDARDGYSELHLRYGLDSISRYCAKFSIDEKNYLKRRLAEIVLNRRLYKILGKKEKHNTYSAYERFYKERLGRL